MGAAVAVAPWRLTMLAMGVAAVAVIALAGSSGSVAVDSPSGARAGDAPLTFVANAGQTDPSVEYMARGPGHAFYFTPDKVVLDFERGERGVALELRFRGANANPQLVGERRASGHVNYISGSARHTNLATYSQLRYATCGRHRHGAARAAAARSSTSSWCGRARIRATSALRMRVRSRSAHDRATAAGWSGRRSATLRDTPPTELPGQHRG